MESSHITGDGGEGCNSSESGWTMYLVSPMQSRDDDDGGSRKGSGSDGSNVDDGYGYTYLVRGRKGGKEYQDDGDDNDSLASDASTGPAKVKAQPSSPDGKESQGHRKDGDNNGEKREEDEEEEDRHTRFSTSSRKKAGNKAEKGGEGKSSKKKGSSSRTSFFW
ncbi:protein SOB FIVE-LIKE 3-like isoform X1 [Triticum dicoccoides]|uniref:protein SOB FIVE-LIKE 3-like isoform X1 n=2 Tax=Triticum dicoccoides TaxID=85692 RepID=UPI000E7978AE|nr:protein SOB FIVE-LIKE 3-like isoform X1 [Triticum dicoccoides]